MSQAEVKDPTKENKKKKNGNTVRVRGSTI